MNHTAQNMQDISGQDFFCVLISILAQNNQSTINLDAEFDEKVEKIFEEFKQNIEGSNLYCSFYIKRNAVHHTSDTLRKFVYNARKDQIISFENPRFVRMRIKISQLQALNNLRASNISKLLAPIVEKYFS